MNTVESTARLDSWVLPTGATTMVALASSILINSGTSVPWQTSSSRLALTNGSREPRRRMATGVWAGQTTPLCTSDKVRVRS